MEYLAYRLKNKKHIVQANSSNTFGDKFHTYYWRPSLTNLIPPQYPKKYFIFWLFHYLKIFSSNNYSVIYISNIENNEIAFYMMIIPRFYKYRFMSKHDVQLIYGITKEKYRRLGLAEFAMRKAIYDIISLKTAFWGIIHKENNASRKWVEKLGFELKGRVKKNKLLKTMTVLEYEDWL